MNIETAKTSELVQYYNDNVPEEKRIKKFRDRATAEKRCRALVRPVETVTGRMEGPTKVLQQTKRKKPTVGHTIKTGILQGKTAKVVIEEVREKHPKSKATKKDVAWWRFELRKAGYKIPVSHYTRRPK